MKNSVDLNKLSNKQNFSQKNRNNHSNHNHSFLKKDTLNPNNERENRKNMNMQFNIQKNTNLQSNSNLNNRSFVKNNVTNNNNQQNLHKNTPKFSDKNQIKYNKKSEKNSGVNWNIPYENVRVIDVDGKMIGAFSKEKAIKIAESKNLDLVLIDERQNPPIARILNFEKYRFEKQKQERIEKNLRRKQNLDTKEIYFRPTTGEHDIQIKLKQSREFLQKGHKVLFSVKMKGREVSHSNLAIDMLKKIKESLSDISQVIKDIQSKENQVSMILQPKKQ